MSTGFETPNANVSILVIFSDEMFSKYVIKSNMHRSYLFVSVICHLGCVTKFREEGTDADLVATYLGKNINFEKKKDSYMNFSIVVIIDN